MAHFPHQSVCSLLHPQMWNIQKMLDKYLINVQVINLIPISSVVFKYLTCYLILLQLPSSFFSVLHQHDLRFKWLYDSLDYVVQFSFSESWLTAVDSRSTLVSTLSLSCAGSSLQTSSSLFLLLLCVTAELWVACTDVSVNVRQTQQQQQWLGCALTKQQLTGCQTLPPPIPTVITFHTCPHWINTPRFFPSSWKLGEFPVLSTSLRHTQLYCWSFSN